LLLQFQRNQWESAPIGVQTPRRFTAKRLKTLKGLTPYEQICKCWTAEPKRFKLNPLQDMPGLNT
jgi:hypothetical protein